MRPLRINFLEPSKPPKWAWWILIALGGIAVALHILASSMAEEARLAQIEQQRQADEERARAAATAQSQPNEPAWLAQALREARFPLNDVLAALENASGEGILLDEVFASAKEYSVRLNLRFASYGDLIRYLEELNSDDKERWRVESAALMEANDHGMAGRAVIVADWD